VDQLDICKVRLGVCVVVACQERRLNPDLYVVQGIPQKLLALETLFEQHPEWRGKLVMFLVVRERSKTDRVIGCVLC
jgi:hypothetical protein